MPELFCFHYRKQMARFRAPGSSANLGPGFDCLALALDVWCDVSVSPAEELTITSSGQRLDVDSANNLAAHVCQRVLGHTRVHIDINSDIPPARGLGSSAALVVACGIDDTEVQRRAANTDRDAADLIEHAAGGTVQQLVDTLGRWSEAGADRIYLQVLDLDDLDHVRLIGGEVLPHLA